MAREDELALMLKTQADEQALKDTRKQLAEAKKAGPGLPLLVNGAITAVTATGLGLIVGNQHGGDPVKREAQLGYAGGLAFVVGAGGAIAAGSNNPKARAALTDIGVAGLAVLGFQYGEKEGVQMAISAAQERAKAQAAAGPQPPAVQGGYRRS